MIKRDRLGVGFPTITRKTAQNVLQVLKNERLSYGPFTQKFEKDFAKQHGCQFGLMVNSGTSALQIAIACLAERHHWKPKDEVIVPAVTFVATSNIVIQQGFKPVFVDVDARTYNIDPANIEAAITPRTRAIIAVHLFGQPADMAAVNRIAKKHRLRVVEDSCETMFATYHGKSVGSLSDIGCFSTYACHILVTGVGGLVTTNNPRYATLLRSLANHGRDGIYTSMDDNRRRGKALTQIVEKRFRFIRNGYSYRVSEFEGAVGCAQLDIAPRLIRARIRNATRLTKALKPFASVVQLPWHPPHVTHSYMMYPIVIQPRAGIKKKDLVMYLERHGVETREMLPLVNQPYYRKHHKVRETDYPVARWINRNGFYVGCHPEMGIREIDHVAMVLKRALSKYLK
ncbi:MAG: hypothetical protein RL141_660 [Candidatus Parcubacteria bacterium]|jgi:dTDP-4-amino-4,6-dideoxygalactose transaminase